MSDEIIEIIRRAYRALSSGDVGAVKDLAAAEIEVASVLSSVEGGPYRGHPGLERWFADVGDAWETLEQTPELFVEIDEERTIALTTARVTGKSSGVEIEQLLAAIWSIRDGKVVRVETHRSLNDALKAAGPAMSRQNIDHIHLILNLFDAWNAQDADAVREGWTADAEWRPAVTGGGIIEGTAYHGHEGLDEFMAVQAETWESVVADPLSIKGLGDRVLVKVRLSAVGRASGIPVDRITWAPVRAA